MKVAVFSAKIYDREYLDQANCENKHELIFFDESLQLSTATLATGCDAVCVMVSDKIDNVVLKTLSAIGVKLITLRSTGFDNVDIEAAAKINIKVMRVPSYSPESIAEHATALILTLSRKIHKAFNRVRDNNFSLNHLMGFTLSGKTVGVIGTGKIGRAFCSIMLGFGCRVIAYDIKENKLIKERGIQYKSFDEVLQESDIVSIHCPLTSDTHYLFNKSSMSKLKKGAMLINTSRGGIVDTSEAVEALKTGQLGYLGIDVYEDETNIFFKDMSDSVVKDDLIERLMSFNNVIITPHQGFFTKEAIEQISLITIKNLSDFQNGLPSFNEVKPIEKLLRKI